MDNNLKVTGTIPILNEEEYLASKGVAFCVSGYCLDKMRGNRQLKTERGKKRFFSECEKAEQEYQEKRKQAKEEYRKLVEDGLVRPETPLERRIRTANGNPDNAATQAARRLLAKQGIAWC